MANRFLIKRGDGAPSAAALSEYELVYDYTGNQLYTKVGTTVTPIGGSPTSGSNNQVLTDDGSGGIVSEGQMTFDGGALNLLTTTANRRIEIGLGATQDVTSFVDLIGDTTYSDYGGRFIRFGGANAETRIMHRGTGDLALLAQDSASISFRTGSTERLRISSAGDVDIKATKKLFFDGGNGTYVHELSDNVIEFRTDNNPQLKIDNSAGVIVNDGSYASFDFRVESNNNTHMLFVDSGNDRVGIGTGSPAAKIHVQDSDGSNLARFKDSDSSHAGIIIAADTNGGHIGNSGGYAGEGIYFQDSLEVMRFYAAGGEKMRLTGTGRLGIGTTSPLGHLDINTEAAEATKVYINGEASQDKLLLLRHYGNSEAAGANAYAGFIGSIVDDVLSLGHYTASGTELGVMHITEVGRVGIGTQTPAQALEVIGDIRIKQGAGYSNYCNIDATEARLTLETYSINTSNHPGDIIFKPAGTEKMRIGDDGVVDISGSLILDTPLAIAEGGTGATNAHNAKINLGLGTLADLHEVTAATIKNNEVGADELDVSGDGTNGQYLASDGAGGFNWLSFVSSTNAGTLDNLDSTQFLRSDTGDTAAGNITFTAKLLGNTSTTSILNGANVSNLNDGFTNDITTSKASGLQPFRYSNSSSNTPLGGSGSMVNNANWGLSLYSHGTGGGGNYGLQMSGGDNDNQLFFIRRVSNGSFGSWFEMWHSGNDGAGSGLDADNLDGTSWTGTNKTVRWDNGRGYHGNPRSMAIGYSGGNYGQFGYNIDFTTTSGQHTYAFNDIATRCDLYDGLQVYTSVSGGTAGSTISWTELLRVRNNTFTYKGSQIPTMANGSNNRVMTSNDAYSINGEGNLTFDGTDLFVAHSSGAIKFAAAHAADKIQLYSGGNEKIGTEANTLLFTADNFKFKDVAGTTNVTFNDSGQIAAASLDISGSVTADTLVGNSNNTNTLLFNDDQTGASNMTSLQCINHINIMTDGNNNGTGNFRVYNGSYDTDTADLAFQVNSVGNTFVYGDLNVDSNTLYVDSADSRVGIATTSPDELLHIFGAAPFIKIENSTETSGGILFVDQQDEGQNASVRFDASARSLDFLTDSGEAMTITGTANGRRIGIGTGSPGALLTVRKDGTQASSVSTSYQIQTVSNSNGGIAIQAGASSDAFLVFGDNGQYDAGRIRYHNDLHHMDFCTSGNNPRMTIQDDGHIAIANTKRFIFDGVDGNTYINQNTGSSNRLDFVVNGSGSMDLFNNKLQVNGYLETVGGIYVRHGGSDYSPAINFLGGTNTSGSNAYENATMAYYDNNGTGYFRSRIGRYGGDFRWVIGDAGGDVECARISKNGLKVSGGSAAAPSLSFVDDPDLGFYRNGSNNIRFSAGNSIRGTWNGDGLVLNGGSLGVNVAVDTTDGVIRAGNDVIAYYSSDERLKENVKPIDNALDKVSKIRGVEFDWIVDKEIHPNEGHDVGVIAQEIEKVLPEVVETRDSGYKAVKYEKIVSLLIEAVNEQQQQINELKEKLNG